MAEVKDLERAKYIFSTLCQALDKNDWRYKKDEEDLSIECGAQGDDLPIELKIRVDAERQLVLLISFLPFAISEEKRIDVAIAVSTINNVLVDGCFDYDVSSGKLLFRMTNSFMDSMLSEEVFTYLLLCSCKTIDDYNDKLLMLSKGLLSIEQFISSFDS